MGMSIVAEYGGIDPHHANDGNRGDQDQKRYPLSGQDQEILTEPVNQDQGVTHEERKMQGIAELLEGVRDIGADSGDVEILGRFAVDIRRLRHLREPVEQLKVAAAIDAGVPAEVRSDMAKQEEAGHIAREWAVRLGA